MKIKGAANSPLLYQRGLTLIEIMVVLTILSIVLVFLGSKILGAGDKAKAKLTDASLERMAADIEQYRLQYSALPGSLDDLVQCNQKTGPGCVPISKDDDLKDAWGNKFLYSLDNGGRAYRIKSLGADGRDGGEGVNYDRLKEGP